MKKYLWFAFIIMPMYIFAQLSESISTTPDTCNGNGAVSITLDNTTPDYNYRFLLERAGGSGPEDTKDESTIATGTSLTQEFNTLRNGTWNYTITVTDNSGNSTGEELSGNFIIEDQNVTPNLTATAEPNCSNHDITAMVSGGSFASYELLDESNNVVRPEQPSNEFISVPPGSYRVVGITSCGTRVVQSILLDEINASYTLRRPEGNSFLQFGFNTIVSCNADDGSRTVAHTIEVRLNGSPVTPDRYPITVNYKVKSDTGAVTDLITLTFADEDDYYDRRNVELDLQSDAFSIISTVTDSCGVTSDPQEDEINTNKDVIVTKPGADCGGQFASIDFVGFTLPITLTFDQAPADFLPSNFVVDDQIADDTNMTLQYPTFRGSSSNNVFLGSSSNPLPEGSYEVTFTDECGTSVTRTWSITQNLVLRSNLLPSCDMGKISAKIYLGNGSTQLGDITSAQITNGPTNPDFTYPYDVTPFINNGAIYLESLVPGVYEFTLGNNENSCNVSLVQSLTLSGLNETKINVTNTEITTYCGTFDYTFTVEGVHSQSTTARLQKYNPANGLWLQMDSQSSVQNNSGDGTYTLNVTNQSVIEGTYRLVFQFSSYSHTSTSAYGTINCEYVYEQFEYDGGRIRLDDFYATACTPQNETYDLIVDASGAEPIEYKILSVNGDASLGTAYQTDPVFYNVSPGTYQVEIKDDCGNTEIASLNITRVKAPHIIADLCDGEFGTLRTAGLTNYETRWYKDGVLISGDDTSDNVLSFDPFDETADLGSYYAEIIYTAGASCGPVITPTYNVTGNTATAPNAGDLINPNPTNTIIDNNGDNRTNLFNYIENYDNQGTWEEISTNGDPISNLLIDNEWYYGLALSGTYTFKHTVEGTCSGMDETIVVINYTAPCDRTFNQGQPEGFTNIGISNLDKHNVEDWPNSVPNGFIVLESDTKGFTISRMVDPENSITDPKEGMLVFDTDEDNGKGCFKLYDGSAWKCIKNCNDQ